MKGLNEEEEGRLNQDGCSMYELLLGDRAELPAEFDFNLMVLTSTRFCYQHIHIVCSDFIFEEWGPGSQQKVDLWPHGLGVDDVIMTATYRNSWLQQCQHILEYSSSPDAPHRPHKHTASYGQLSEQKRAKAKESQSFSVGSSERKNE